jgi:hypothetical protein
MVALVFGEAVESNQVFTYHSLEGPRLIVQSTPGFDLYYYRIEYDSLTPTPTKCDTSVRYEVSR